MTTWMVVEDEPDLYGVLLAVSQIWGTEGVAFVDGEEAIAWIDDVDNGCFHGELPVLALIDIRLPGTIAGPAVGARVRASAILCDMAIVLSTSGALSPEKTGQIMQEAGADRLIDQPLPGNGELQKLFEDVIADHNTKAELKAQSGRRKYARLLNWFGLGG